MLRIGQNEQDAYEEECIRQAIEMNLAIEQHGQDKQDAYEEECIREMIHSHTPIIRSF